MTTTAAQARQDPRIREQRRAQAARRRVRLIMKAKELHTELVTKLGGECEICGEKGETAPLSIDHKVGHGWGHRHNAINYYQRVRRYMDEYLRGVPLRVLCVPCNSANRPDPGLEEAPF